MVDIQAHGIKITVEEGRSIQGQQPHFARSRAHRLTPSLGATANAYLQANTFASYVFTPLPTPRLPTPEDEEEEEEETVPHESFGISLSTLLECLNIFGNATGAGGTGWKGGEGGAGGARKKGEWGEGREREWSGTDEGKMTSLRLSYGGEGEPLVLL